jgi:hypothetical protein
LRLKVKLPQFSQAAVAGVEVPGLVLHLLGIDLIHQHPRHQAGGVAEDPGSLLAIQASMSAWLFGSLPAARKREVGPQHVVAGLLRDAVLEVVDGVVDSQGQITVQQIQRHADVEHVRLFRGDRVALTQATRNVAGESPVSSS